MSSPDRAPRRARASLSREAVVEAAVDVLDEDGLDGLTMRAVAKRLDAGAMSLYRHVSGREELLDLVVARLTADMPDLTPTGDWRTDLSDLARDVRAMLLRRPNLTVLMTARAGAGAGALAPLDRALGILRGAGFEPRDAALANHALGNYVAGAALWEAAGLGGTTGDRRRTEAEAAGREIGALADGTWPNVAWAAAALFDGTAQDRFEFGLEVLLDGLAARAAAGGR